jgi:hypothetical protein
MVGRQKIIGNQEEIRLKVSMELCKHCNMRKGKFSRALYQKIVQDLITLGVSPRYVGDLWRKHEEKIFNTMISPSSFVRAGMITSSRTLESLRSLVPLDVTFPRESRAKQLLQETTSTKLPSSLSSPPRRTLS